MRAVPLALSMWVLLGSPIVMTARAQQDAAASPVLVPMQQELARSMTTFRARPVAPYFLSYEIRDARSVSVQGAFGALTWANDAH